MAAILKNTKTQALANALFICMCALILVIGGNLLTGEIERLLNRQAQYKAQEWASYLLSVRPNLPDIVESRVDAAADATSLPPTDLSGMVTGYRIYDSAGRLKVWGGQPMNGHSMTSVRVEGGLLPEGLVRQKLANGSADALPAIVRVQTAMTAGGRSFGTMITDIDQTALRADYITAARRMSGVASLFLFLVVSLGFLLRAIARQEDRRRLSFFVNNDRLTSLPNRESFMRMLQTTVSSADPERDRIAVYMIDIDRFVRINEMLGAQGADRVLHEFAGRIAAVCQTDAFAARLEGDNFAVIMNERDTEDSAIGFGLRLKEATDRPIDYNGAPVLITSSIGFACLTSDIADAFAFFKRAEMACVAAKERGGHQVLEYNAHLLRQHERARSLEVQIAEATRLKTFELHYQPIVSLGDRKLVSFEALIRMNDAEGKPIAPSEFIPLAERIGLIGEIGRWTLDEACRTASELPEHLSIAINLSPLQFTAGDLVEEVRSTLARHKVAPHRLDLEITEGLLLNDSDDVIDQLSQLRQLGVRIVLDDFGTGYSSMNYLWRFGFDKIKIDQSFIRAIDDHPKAREVLATIIKLGRTLNLPITAEGIETERHAEYLSSLDCDRAQGYLFGRPVQKTLLASVVMRDFTQSMNAEPEAQAGTYRSLKAAS